MYIFVFKVKAQTCLFLSSLGQEFASGAFGQVFILFRIFIMLVDFISVVIFRVINFTHSFTFLCR